MLTTKIQVASESSRLNALPNDLRWHVVLFLDAKSSSNLCCTSKANQCMVSSVQFRCCTRDLVRCKNLAEAYETYEKYDTCSKGQNRGSIRREFYKEIERFGIFWNEKVMHEFSIYVDVVNQTWMRVYGSSLRKEKANRARMSLIDAMRTFKENQI